MKATVYHRYGSPDVLEIQEIEKPALADDGVLVRVRAASINPANWYRMMGRPSLFLRRMAGRGEKPWAASTMNCLRS